MLTRIRYGVWMMMMMISQFNGTSVPKGTYSAKTGDNDCYVSSIRYSLRTALCESICYQVKSEQNVRQDLIPRVLHGEAALMHPIWGVETSWAEIARVPALEICRASTWCGPCTLAVLPVGLFWRWFWGRSS